VELRQKKYSTQFHYISYEYFTFITPLHVGFMWKKTPSSTANFDLSYVTNRTEIAQ